MNYIDRLKQIGLRNKRIRSEFYKMQTGTGDTVKEISQKLASKENLSIHTIRLIIYDTRYSAVADDLSG